MSSAEDFDVENHSDCILENAQKFRDLKRYCDVILSISENNFPAHRVILAASSQYFDKMFSANMKEKHAGTVVLQDITVSALDSVLTFIYTGKITLRFDQVADLLHASHMMQIMDLLDLIVSYLLNNLDELNCLTLRDLSIMYSLEELRDSSDEFLIRNFEVISRQNAFRNITKNDLRVLLSSDALLVNSETTVYEALVAWVKKDIPNRRNYFPELFQLIRLQLVPPDYLCDEIRQEVLVRTFPGCVEMMENALDFHIRPDKYTRQTPRKGHFFDSNTVAICCTQNMFLYNHRLLTWKKFPLTEQLPRACAVASRYQTIVFCGGYSDNAQTACSTVLSFDGSSWREFPPMKSERAGAAAVYVQGELYIFGGEKNRNRRKEDFVDDFEMLNETEESWVSVGELETIRSYAEAVVHKGTVYLLGGYVPYENASHPNRACKIVRTYNINSNSWETITDMPQERACFGAALWRNNIYVFGGFSSNDAIQDNGAFMNITDRTWTNVTTAMPVQLGTASACPAKNNIIIVGERHNGLVVINPNSLKYESNTQTLPGLTGGRIVEVVWKQRFA